MKNFNSANALKSLESLATKVESLRVSYEEAESIDKIPYDNLSYTDVEPFLVRFNRHLKMVESLLETIQEDLDDAVSLLDDFEPLEELKIDFSLNKLYDDELHLIDYLWSIRNTKEVDTFDVACWLGSNTKQKVRKAFIQSAQSAVKHGLNKFSSVWDLAKYINS